MSGIRVLTYEYSDAACTNQIDAYYEECDPTCIYTSYDGGYYTNCRMTSDDTVSIVGYYDSKCTNSFGQLDFKCGECTPWDDGSGGSGRLFFMGCSPSPQPPAPPVSATPPPPVTLYKVSRSDQSSCDRSEFDKMECGPCNGDIPDYIKNIAPPSEWKSVRCEDNKLTWFVTDDCIGDGPGSLRFRVNECIIFSDLDSDPYVFVEAWPSPSPSPISPAPENPYPPASVSASPDWAQFALYGAGALGVVAFVAALFWGCRRGKCCRRKGSDHLQMDAMSAGPSSLQYKNLEAETG